MIVRRKHVARAGREREGLAHQTQRSTGIGGEHDIVDPGIRVHVLQHAPARTHSPRSGVRRCWILRVRIAEHVVQQAVLLRLDLRRRVKRRTRVIQVRVPRCVQPAVLHAPQPAKVRS